MLGANNFIDNRIARNPKIPPCSSASGIAGLMACRKSAEVIVNRNSEFINGNKETKTSLTALAIEIRPGSRKSSFD